MIILLKFCVSAPQMAYPKSHNPFADDDDEEDFKPKRRGFDDDDDPDDSGLSEAERKQRYLQQEVMRTAQSAVDSSYRSISLIYESEKMGVETAEVHQPNSFTLTHKKLACQWESESQNILVVSLILLSHYFSLCLTLSFYLCLCRS